MQTAYCLRQDILPFFYLSVKQKEYTLAEKSKNINHPAPWGGE
jgi:hypothetical protein